MKLSPKVFVGLLALLLLSQPILLSAPVSPQGKTISFSEIGDKATADYKGDAIGITKTAEGAALRTGFQKLAGTVEREGLRLISTEEGGGSLCLVATSVGRGDSKVRLTRVGNVTVTDRWITFTRPGLIEEYSVTADGVRQDFIVLERPEGEGELQVELDLQGALATAASSGVRLILDGSKRELAYSRLHVVDAKGRTLAATPDILSPDRLAIRVDDTAAVYPVRIDPTFSDADWVSLNPGIPGVNGIVYATTVDGSGNLYVGGDFSVAGTVSANRIAKWNGTSWSALGLGMDGAVNAVAMIGSDLYVGGGFTSAGGVPASRIAKWDGLTWSAIGSGMDNVVNALTVIDDDLYVGGGFMSAGGVPASRIAKWDGASWSALGSGMNSVVLSLTAGGGHLYAGGDFTSAGAVSAHRIARWDGSTWSPLGTGMASSVRALVASGGDLYAGGNFTNAGGVPANHIAKWDGTTWSALGSGLAGGVGGRGVRALVADGGNIYAGGIFTTAGEISVNRIAKWDGSAWAGLNPTPLDYPGAPIQALAINGGELYAGGGFSTAGGVVANSIAQWNGSAWSALGSGMNAGVHAVAVSGSDLYVGGDFTTTAGVAVNHVAKWNGSAWSTLGSGLNGSVAAIAVSGSVVYASGYFSTAGGLPASYIAKWDGSVWSALGSGLDSFAWALALDGTDLYAGGSFTSAGGVSANRIAKWDGTSWVALGTGMNGEVDALAVNGSDLYAGGSFTTAGGVAVKNIAKWDGSVWTDLGPGIHGVVRALAVSGGDLFASGSRGGMIPGYTVSRWNGSTWSELGSGMNQPVRALATSGNDLYAGGEFTTAGGVAANRIAKWNGSNWSALGSGMDSDVFALAADSTNHLFLGGSFFVAGTTVSPFIAQANLAPGPEIAIEQPPTSSVPDGGSRSFGSVALGADLSFTFTIKNTGTAELTGLVITLDQTDSDGFDDFTLTTDPVAPVSGPDGTTSFTVRFAPGNDGTKSATLHIASNDADENPFDILLSGSGASTAAVFNDVITANSGLSGPEAAPDAIPFNDGVENLLKYAFNMNLAGPDNRSLTAGTGTAGLPAFSMTGEGEATEIRVEFIRRKGSGLSYTPKRSSTLMPGSFVPIGGTPVVTSIDDNWERVVVAESADPESFPQSFAIVEVTIP